MAKGGSGGSHGSGRVEYPPYLTNLHSYALWGYDLTGNQLPFNIEPADGSIFALIERARVGTLDVNSPPFVVIPNLASQRSIPNPDDYFNFSDDFNELDEIIEDIVPTNDDSDTLDKLAFEQELEAPHLRALNRFTGQMFDVNAVNSSAFIWGVSLLEQTRQRSIANYRETRNEQYVMAKANAKAQAIQLKTEYARVRLIAKVDEVDQHVNYTMQAQLFDLELYEYGSNMMASISGAVTDKATKGSKIQSALAGGLIGAGMGAAVGSMFPNAWAGATAAGPVGLGIGLVGGLIFGLLS